MDIEKLMMRAISIAERGRGLVSPNPLVGAVVYKNGKIVSEDYHPEYGRLHAERRTILKAGKKAKGATLIVNLEPCNHFGKTPPCTDIILKTGIKEVIVGMKDPNPVVNGEGIKELKRKGIRVILGVCEKQARFLNRGYVYFYEKKRPWVVIKGGVTLDGKIASTYGESRWITSEESRDIAHILRYTSDAVCVGINTVKKDNPDLSPHKVRKKLHPLRRPVRVVFDTNLNIHQEAKIFKLRNMYPVIIYTKKEKELKKDNVIIVKAKKGNRISLKEVMRDFYKRNFQYILVEGGSSIYFSFFKEGFVDEVFYFYSPKILGGKNSPTLCGGKGFHLKNAYPVLEYELKRLSNDFLFHGICSQV